MGGVAECTGVDGVGSFTHNFHVAGEGVGYSGGEVRVIVWHVEGEVNHLPREEALADLLFGRVDTRGANPRMVLRHGEEGH
jgi:hypothetical protein